MESELTIRKHSNNLERSSWILAFFALLTQLSSEYAFPSYNVALAFWGCYAAFSKHGRTTFGFIIFSFLSLLLDVIYCSINRPDSVIFKFCLAIFVVCMFIKSYCLYVAAHFFASIGGALSMDDSYMAGDSAYDSLASSGNGGSNRSFGAQSAGKV